MRSFDLITCMHGLHYLGDKSALPARTASWLTATGRLIADVDLASIRLADGRPAGRRLTTRLRTAGFTYDPQPPPHGRMRYPPDCPVLDKACPVGASRRRHEPR